MVLMGCIRLHLFKDRILNSRVFFFLTRSVLLQSFKIATTCDLYVSYVVVMVDLTGIRWSFPFPQLLYEWLRGKVIQVQNSIFSAYVILKKLNI